METLILWPGGFLNYREAPGSTYEITNIAVDNNRRRLGVGRKLVEQLFKQIGPDKRVWAITRAENEIAQKFYEALLFEVVAPLRRFYGKVDGVDAIMYGRSSSGPV